MSTNLSVNEFDGSSSTLPIHIQDEQIKNLTVPITSINTSSSQTHTATTHLNEDTDALDGEINEKQLEKQHIKDPFLVVFSPGDSENPKNWGRLRRWFLTLAASFFVLNSTFASSSPAGIIQPIIAHFHLEQEVAILTVSLFVAGYCLGPLLWGPLSEQYGRRPIFIISFIFYFGFQIGCALSPNAAALLIFRFLGGSFAAAPLTNSGALIADIWDIKTRGNALALFSLAPFAGPAIGPAVGGFIYVSGATWRWLYWTLACFSGACLLVIIIFVPETYEPIILVQKAHRIRKETGDVRYYAAFEKQAAVSVGQRVKNILTKPFIMLAQEPMLIAITVYMAFLYGCVYLLFEAYPIVFQEGHGMNAGIGGLMFIPIMLGATVSIIAYFVYFEPNYQRKVRAHAPSPVPPEARLDVAAWGAILFVISFFWFGWTSYPSISFWAPMLAGLPMGASIVMMFLSLTNYIIDVYLRISATALAVVTVVRSLAGAGFPLFATQMYVKLNPRWASTLLGFIALIMVPIPFVLIRYGPVIRKRSKYAPS